MSFILSRINKCIIEKDNFKLATPFIGEEVYESLKEIGSTKAPGIDGFSALFYQKF